MTIDGYIRPDVISSENVTDGWETVKTKKHRPKQEFNKSHVEEIFFFRDEANSPVIDFVGMVSNVRELVDKARNEKWAHGYCMYRNKVYDFNDYRRPGSYRTFDVPNTAYMHKFGVWRKEYEEASQDTTEYFLFNEKSTWSEWTFIGRVRGLINLRNMVKARIVNSIWMHAFTVTDNLLYNFMLNDKGSLLQKKSEAPFPYMKRFDDFIKKHGITLD